MTYSVSGADANKVTIDPATGEVRLKESPDYETQSSYDFRVNASDSELTGSTNVTVNVSDVNEAPVLATPGPVTLSVDESISTSTVISPSRRVRYRR